MLLNALLPWTCFDCLGWQLQAQLDTQLDAGFALMTSAVRHVS